MHPALLQLLANLQRARDIAALQSTLALQTTSALDSSDLLRASLVLQLSALDSYFHEAVRLGMLEVFGGSRARTKAFDSFAIMMADHQRAIHGDTLWFDAAIRRSHGWKTFQHPDKIAEAVALASPVAFWDEVARIMGRPSKDVRGELVAIVERRNKIAHEADLDPTFPGTRWPISIADVSQSAAFVEQIGRAATSLIL